MLSYRDLKTIQEGNRRNEDVMTLLREVKRLRDLAALTYSAIGHVPLNGFEKDVATKLGHALSQMAAEPAVKEYLLAKKKLDDLEFRRKRAQETGHVRQDQAGEKP